MERFDRIFELHKIMAVARRPVPMKRLMEELECSRATVHRIINELRDFLGAPIRYNRRFNGYEYASEGGHSYELPGLWFNPSELHALLATQQLLADVQPGLLESHLAPLRRRIEQILETGQMGAGEVASRVKILRMAARPAGEHYRTVAGALMRRRRLRMTYHGRGRNRVSERVVSPQRLVHYRDNWYLDAWCHERKALRSFAVDRIQSCGMLEEACKELPVERLDRHFSDAYGIFSGRAKGRAVLRFSPERARWVADEQWHPQQQAQFLDDGSYQLTVPFSDSRELVMDILRYGPDVEVMSPRSLREQVRERLRAALEVYS